MVNMTSHDPGSHNINQAVQMLLGGLPWTCQGGHDERHAYGVLNQANAEDFSRILRPQGM